LHLCRLHLARLSSCVQGTSVHIHSQQCLLFSLTSTHSRTAKPETASPPHSSPPQQAVALMSAKLVDLLGCFGHGCIHGCMRHACNDFLADSRAFAEGFMVGHERFIGVHGSSVGGSEGGHESLVSKVHVGQQRQMESTPETKIYSFWDTRRDLHGFFIG